MPNDQSAADANTDIEAFVEKWLKTKGVRLELDVAAAFRKHLPPDAVEHGRYYVTDEPDGSRKVREIDVVAQCLTLGYQSDSSVCTWFIVECKSATNDPWLLYSSETTSRFVAQDSLGLARDTIKAVERGATVGQLDPMSALDAAGSIFASTNYAYQIADTGEDPTKSNSKQSAFDAVRQVLSATDGSLADVADQMSRSLLCVFVPVVVTAAPLFTVEIEGSDYKLKRSKYVPLIGRFQTSDRLNLVWIVQADALDEYVNIAVTGARQLRVKRPGMI